MAGTYGWNQRLEPTAGTNGDMALPEFDSLGKPLHTHKLVDSEQVGLWPTIHQRDISMIVRLVPLSACGAVEFKKSKKTNPDPASG